ncbi:Fic family protein [Coprococcus comes ATCC 27758]|uniref:Fido domain-containing protein n=1 Tax=Coprococcus comes ATCC 27758 TaxID=470146 RepID=C0BCR8_9FIRM|nr:Fic family protein [Coprococcus comes]EEG88869.1 hypothetical protein COPCOM_02959 [Coprococcus comes ATCC 27758]QRT49982.1 Fic family protein [Coprococcus comes]UWP15548.1 Fic family protein [Coprococcus comes ATCC 27758]
MADLGEEAFSSQMKVVATFLRLLEELMRNKQQDLRYGTKTQRRGILGRMKDFVGGIFKKVYDGTFGRLSRNGKDYGQLDLNDPAVATTVINNLKHGWQFIFDFIDAPIDLSYVRQVHQLVSNNLVPDSGQLRYFDVYIGGTSWQPEIPDFDTAKAAIEKIANMEPGRERALKMFGYLCRSQLFSDGNKRTAQLIANKMLIADGCGILAIPKEQINNFETLLLDFYETNKPDKFFSFLTKEAIYGLDRTVPSSQNLKVKCKAATLGSNALKTRSNTVGISKTQNADRTAHTEHIE